ncbi:YraN family protein [Eudoraea chungangensis]|uniref:YraN family protein n=1 Tax=Eudoraea chungangensis TaxID=1481905 RepID=UPI0023EB8DC4|nr:YraN family protein [Eudoraea chungangensis]
MARHNHFGSLGEDLAVDFLQSLDYEILERNYRYLKAEIDILARKDDLLVVVEVKARSSGHLKPIAETVSKKKIALLVMATDNYIVLKHLEVEVRFDIITIEKTQTTYKMEHIKDAFYYF